MPSPMTDFWVYAIGSSIFLGAAFILIAWLVNAFLEAFDVFGSDERE